MITQNFKAAANAATLCALLVLGAPVWAQDTTGDTAPEAAADAAPAATPDNGLDLGTPVDDGPQVGEPFVREVFGDWALRCIRVEEGPEPCQLYQLLLDQDDNPIAEVSIVPLAPGGAAVAGAVIIVPLETLLTAELTLSIDGSQARRYPYDFCNRAGCIARFGMNQEQIDQLKRGSAGTITIVPAQAPDAQVVLSMSLTGFTAGLTATTAAPQ